MNSTLAQIYCETLHAQAGLQNLAQTGALDLGAWNEIDESLDAAAEGFRAYRRIHLPDRVLKPASPGLAGGENAPAPALAPITPYHPA